MTTTQQGKQSRSEAKIGFHVRIQGHAKEILQSLFQCFAVRNQTRLRTISGIAKRFVQHLVSLEQLSVFPTLTIGHFEKGIVAELQKIFTLAGALGIRSFYLQAPVSNNLALMVI